jgi:hypothetical protein
MKKFKFIFSLALSTTLLLTTITANATVFNDGSVGGKFIKNVDGKTIVEFPVNSDVKKLQQKKTNIADLHFKYKNGEISKIKYSDGLKKLGADSDTLNSVDKVVPFTTSATSKSGYSTAAYAVSNRISDLVQQSQINSYYCGPATASELINAKVHTLYSQSTVATDLRCSSQTSWYDGAGATGYPMADTLNKYATTYSYYTPYGTTIAAATFQSHIVFDIDHDWGVAGDAYEVVGGLHLVGHPNSNIFHWFAIDGYLNNANDIWYLDSVAGASSISWNSSVPRYSHLNYSNLATIVNGRGIIW